VIFAVALGGNFLAFDRGDRRNSRLGDRLRTESATSKNIDCFHID
jgi:hypothetical protein